jgi:hypothetical protein
MITGETIPLAECTSPKHGKFLFRILGGQAGPNVFMKDAYEAIKRTAEELLRAVGKA